MSRHYCLSASLDAVGGCYIFNVNMNHRLIGDHVRWGRVLMYENYIGQLKKILGVIVI